MKLAAKILAVPLLVVVAFVVSAYVQFYIPGRLVPFEQPRTYVEMVSTALIAAGVAGAVVAAPLVLMFGRQSWLVGVIVAAPLIVMRASDFVRYIGKDEPRIIVMSVAEMLIYPAVFGLITWALHKYLSMRGTDRKEHAA